MKKEMPKTEAQRKIEEFFGHSEFSQEGVKKIKRLAMKFKIGLKNYRKLFCKRCLAKLRGKIRINKTHKIAECERCGFVNRIRID